MRLFVAVRPSARARTDLQDVVSELTARSEVDDRYRFTHPDQWHITLAFLGEVDDRLVPELQRRMARAAWRHSPMWLRLAGAGAFSSPQRARVCWVGVGGDTDRLAALAGSVAAGARRAKVEVDAKKRFRPHLTLARLKTPTDVRAVVDAWSDYQGPWWRATEIAVVRSRLGQASGGRAVHESVATHALTADDSEDGTGFGSTETDEE